MHVVQPESGAIITADLQVGVSMCLMCYQGQLETASFGPFGGPFPGFDAYVRGCRCTHLSAWCCRYIAVGRQSQEQVDIVVVIHVVRSSSSHI